MIEKTEDARFHGVIEAIGNGAWLARCGVRLNYGAGALHEEPETLHSYNPDALRSWVESQAAERGYATVVWEGDAARWYA